MNITLHNRLSEYRSTRRPRSAFTLIEVLVTTSIAAILLGAIVGVAARLEPQRQQLQRDFRTSTRNHFLRRIVERDLVQANSVTLDEARLVLTGALATDENGAATFQIAVVEYRVENGKLVRVESGLRRQRRQLLWIGAKQLLFQRLSASTGGTALRVTLLDEDNQVVLRVVRTVQPGVVP